VCAATGVQAAGAAGPRLASGLVETAPPKQLGSRLLALRLLPLQSELHRPARTPGFSRRHLN
jgi:hypothetical protein